MCAHLLLAAHKVGCLRGQVHLDPAEWGVGAAAGHPEVDDTLQMVHEETGRLAAVDLDWSRMRAVDIFAVLQSFVKGHGTLRRVVIYVSDYGKQEMAHEKAHGPRSIAVDSVRVYTADDNAAQALHTWVQRKRLRLRCQQLCITSPYVKTPAHGCCGAGWGGRGWQQAC